jgi:drug/metabolite transporter (DMT)-like permease
MSADAKSGGLFGIAGVVMALCCLAGPAIVGAAAGAAIGNLLGIAAAVLIAFAGVLVVRRRRRGNERAC